MAESFVEYFIYNYKNFLSKKFTIFSDVDLVKSFHSDRKFFLGECMHMVNEMDVKFFKNEELRKIILLLLDNFEIFLPGSFRVKTMRKMRKAFFSVREECSFSSR